MKNDKNKPQLYLVQMGVRPLDILRVSLYTAGQNYSDLINTRLKLAALGRTLEQQENHIQFLKEHHDYCHHVDESIKSENKCLNSGIDEWIYYYDNNNQNAAAHSMDEGHMEQHQSHSLLSLAREWAYCSGLQKSTQSAIIQAQLSSLDTLIQKRRKRITMLKNFKQNPERMKIIPSTDFAEDELQSLVENARTTPVKDLRPGPLLLAMLVNPRTPI